ncbi:Highly divergent homeobox [Liparis tanakae]|uniref:Highly divergent homeobox n=1 Tax=Liparis tanakae TaxID=230148 RepID=A0A4Z2H890_9TELE|nr:Highly divergent homeobox [Liparis tanakae]
MAAPFPSRMDAWAERRGLQTMNLRSVFTAEQQRILERYYDNGMTNQSKACFQHILQCAQESKLDFSVVRTWVGNKRRKIASKVENGGMSHSLSGHGLSGGLLSGCHSLAGGPLSNHGLASGPLLPAELAAGRNIPNRVHLLPPSSSFPSFSSTSSSPSSSSPRSSGSHNNNNNNNDVILTGIYSLNSVPRSRPRPLAAPPASQSDPEPSSLSGRAPQIGSASSPVRAKMISLSQSLPPLATSASGPLVYTAVRKGAPSLGEAGLVPHSWTRQYGAAPTRPWSSSSQPQIQPQPRPHSNPQPQPPPPLPPPPLPPPPPAPQKTERVALPAPRSGPSSEQTPRIQQVFTLSEGSGGDRLRSSHESADRKNPEAAAKAVVAPHPRNGGQNFSIAMETGDEENEWQREEEMANMAAQSHHLRREQAPRSPTGSEASAARGGRTPPATSPPRPAPFHGNTTLPGSYAITAQTSLPGDSGSQRDSSGVKRRVSCFQLQDRTQFSDGDLVQLKRYWDRGMTSLGSVCREKITAAAEQLNVDPEIVKTWISNRRRKYRLMGIDIPPPKGGPAVFSSSSPGNESPVGLGPDEEGLRTPELEDDLNYEGSVCLSEDGTIESRHGDEEDGIDASTAMQLANTVKVEVIDEEYGANEDGDLVASDLEQMQSLLEFKHEEVQFLEIELENQKQKYDELTSFTKSLLAAVRSNDLERQQELVASLPQPSDQDWDMTEESGARLADAADASFDRGGSPMAGAESPSGPNGDVPPVSENEDDAPSDATEPSASEERRREEAFTELE